MSGDPVYPDCGRVICYDYRAGQLCKRCGRQFGVTTGTAFDGRKLAIWHNLMADPGSVTSEGPRLNVKVGASS